ncbi:MAG TPA: hypothetical protein VF912_00025 [Anaeromyxobacter sp.]
MRWNTTVAVLGAVGALGLGMPVAGLVRAVRSKPDDAPGSADRTLSELRRLLKPGEPIGVVLPEPEDPALAVGVVSRAQYALAPALVEPLWLGDCLTAGPRCRPGAARIAVPRERADVAAALRERLGLGAGSTVGGVLLLERVDR